MARFITPIDEEGNLKDGYEQLEDIENELGADLVVRTEEGLFLAEWYGNGIFRPDIEGFIARVKDAGFEVVASRIEEREGFEDTPQVYFTTV